MVEARRVIIIFVVAVLLSIFVFTTIDAAYPRVEYSDFCEDRYELNKPYQPRPDNFTCPETNFDEAEMQQCLDSEGEIRYEQDEMNCNVDWSCSHCNKNYQDAREKRNLFSFVIAAIAGIIGVVIGLFLPDKKKSVHEWVGSGLMLGGMITIFVATAMYFSDLHRWVRPVIILLELLLVIYLAYKKLSD